ncbi:CDP-glycerol glycerophosphotransferase family protein [Paeniglutamicibacter sp. Y32M11]|uniref:CDP-glycerol glycerophosphotransferase family protein n=1 Tax=Paeniglutamicibacter sp. Y32M11 TaxID=2853258 RepID=UPI001C52EBFF|nr:CDP-glycerol glycerophosphotransferase family protein [Paeniglutamicibacter sp. Y32M11]QXQ08936.1 CDP-glycerol glycerophosphotransferase family protein [Paeniglutamicibacter sp. Y32M11]
MSSPSVTTSPARTQTVFRLRSIAAITVVVALLAVTSFAMAKNAADHSWNWLLFASWVAVCSLILFIPKFASIPALAKFTPIRVGFLSLVGALATARAESLTQIIFSAAAIVIGLISIAGEQLLRRIGLGGGHAVLNLPGTEPLPRVLRMNKSIVLGQLLFLGLGVLAATTALSAGWWLLGGSIVVVLSGIRAISVTRRRRTNYRNEKRIGELVADYAPEFAIYTARPDDASYQVAMWLPYLQRTGKKFIIITRAETPSHALAELTDAPIIMRKRLAGLDDLLVPSLSTVFYVNASSGNGAMVRYNQLTHVYLGHGDSDKAPSYNPTHAMYDKIYAAGPAATRRYAQHGVIMDENKFEIVGRPQLESVTMASRGVRPDATVLYAPTWRGHVDETFLHSIPVAEGIVEALLRTGSTVIFRPHPFSYQFAEDAAIIEQVKALLAADAAASGRKHLWGAAAESELDIIGCMNASDAMVSDVSSVVSDYLYSAKPFAMVAVNVPVAEFSTEYPIARAAYVLEAQLENLDDTLLAMLGEDPMYNRRLELRTDYLGDFPQETYVEGFIQAAINTIESGARHPDEPEVFDQEVEDSAPAVGEETDPEAEDGSAADAQADEQSDAQNDDPSDAPADEPVDELSEEEREAAREVARLQRRARAKRRRLKNALLRVAKQLLPNVMAGLALTAAAIASISSLWFVIPALLTVAFCVYVNRRGFRNQSRMNQFLGAFAPARATVAATLALGLLGHGTDSAVGAALIFLGIALEGQAVAVWRAAGLQSRNLPGTEQAKPLPYARGLAAMVASIALAIMLVVSYLVPDLGYLHLILGITSFALTAHVLLSGLRRRYVNLVLEAQLPELLAAVGPRFMVYFGSNVGVSYQLGMWVEYLDRIGMPYIVVTRDLKMMRAAAKVTDAPVIYRRTLGSLETVLVPGLTTAFYVNNAVKNTHLIERRELHHIWLNHGDSEKPACFNPVHAIYDEIFSAGQAGIDRYERHGVHIPREKFAIVGRPQVEEIAQGTEGKPPQTVLYAPTWRGPYADSAVYSLPMGEEIVQGLLDRGCTVIFRAHPFNYNFPDAKRMMRRVTRLLREDAAVTGREHLFGAAAEKDMTFVECFNAADAMISDISAMVSDFLFSTKPFAVVAVTMDEAALHETMPATTSGYVLEGSLENYDDVLNKMLGSDPLLPLRSSVKEYYLGPFAPIGYADAFLDAARQRITTYPGVLVP